MIQAFLTGIAQVTLVVFQTRQIARRAPVWQVVCVGMAISSVWIFNVRAAVGSLPSAVAYVIGAGTGTLIAMSLKLKESK